MAPKISYTPSIYIRHVEGFIQVHVLHPIFLKASRFPSKYRKEDFRIAVEGADNVMRKHDGLLAKHITSKEMLCFCDLHLKLVPH